MPSTFTLCDTSHSGYSCLIMPSTGLGVARRLIFAFALVLATVFSVCCSADNGGAISGKVAVAPIKKPIDKLSLVSVSNDYPPFYSANLPSQGVIFHLAQAVFQHAGYPMAHRYYPFARAKAIMKKGGADVILGVWYRPSREEWIAFSAPLLSVNVVLYKRVDSQIAFNTMADLRQYRIGIGRGYANPEAFQNAALKTEAASSDKVNLKKLLAGRIDLVLIGEDVAQYLIAQSGDQFKDKFEVVGEPLSVELFHLGLSRSLPHYQEVLDDFNRSLTEMAQSGEVNRILSEHGFGTNGYWQQKQARR
ncbi:transporter substrate-binding domain-containing protein [Shewanella sp. Isolate8]|uniref:substrate-binding periplasmic protein n=1 Tax=Shewanella sp. Isolate8 TaxID=2908529 RepID=UPI0031F2D64E